MNGDGTKYYLNSNESKDYYPIIKLPDGLSCDQCTLQVYIFPKGFFYVSKGLHICTSFIV